MDKEALAKQSPMSLLGLSDTGPDLLDEVMKGRIGSPGQTLAKGFGNAKETVRDNLAQEAAKELVETPSAGDDLIQPPTKVESQKTEEEDVEPKQLVADEKEEPGESGEEQAPHWFHHLNEQTDAIRQRQDQFDQALRESQRREQAYQQYIQNTQQQMQRHQQPPQDDYSWMQKGFESPEQYNAYRESIRTEAREEITQQMQRQLQPMLHRMAADRFEAALARCRKDYEYFDKYFPAEKLQQYFDTVIRQWGPQQAAMTNFDHEFTNAYRVVDYERLRTQAAKNEEKTKAQGQTKKEEQQERKAQLKLVPKAHQSGGPAGKRSIDDDIAALSDKSIHGLTNHFRKLSGQQ